VQPQAGTLNSIMHVRDVKEAFLGGQATAPFICAFIFSSGRGKGDGDLWLPCTAVPSVLALIRPAGGSLSFVNSARGACCTFWAVGGRTRQQRAGMKGDLNTSIEGPHIVQKVRQPFNHVRGCADRGQHPTQAGLHLRCSTATARYARSAVP
jgi:hypothetical protein